MIILKSRKYLQLLMPNQYDTNIHKNDIYKAEVPNIKKKTSNEYEVDSTFFYSCLGGFKPMIGLNLNLS